MSGGSRSHAIGAAKPPTVIGACRARLAQLALALLLVALAAALDASRACADTPWWHISSETSPTNISPGSEGIVFLHASNLGDTPISSSAEPIVIKAVLPAGVVATSISGNAKGDPPASCSLASLECSFTGVVNPYEPATVTIRFTSQQPSGTVDTLHGKTTVMGGGAASASAAVPIPINGAPASFGFEHFEVQPFNVNGTAATQGGAHEFEFTTTLAFNQTGEPRLPVQLPKDLALHLTPGLLGNPGAATQCTMSNFFTFERESNLCSASSAIGVATVTIDEPVFTKIFTATVPVFNLVPAQGEPARFGFEVVGKVPVVIDTAVRSEGDYGVDATVKNLSETAGVLFSEVTLWGAPGDPRHNNARGWECVAGGFFHLQVGKACPESNGGLGTQAFLTLPTSCVAEPVSFTVAADSWADPSHYVESQYTWSGPLEEPLGFTGCEALPFTPSVSVAPEEHRAGTPTGLSVAVKVPQQALSEPEKLAQADVRDSTVTLPPGVELSPSAANGLAACSEAKVGYEGLDSNTGLQEFSRAQASCPEASKLGIVHIKTPLLPHELEGSVYLATPAPNGEGGQNPFNSLIALYIVAEDPVSGVLVKLAGEGHVDEGTLQVSTSFANTPQVPFEELKLELFGGPRASLTTPALCGAYATEGLFTPWSGSAPVGVSSPAEEFQITEGPGGSPCPAGALPFRPGFLAESLNLAAGAFTPFDLEISRPDGGQAVKGVSMHLPPGVAGMLSSVALCGEPQASEGTCGPESEVGQAIESAGLGPEPFIESAGKVYITGPYAGAPFGLSIVTPAVAGPFNLGTVVVRSRIYIDPETAALTIVSDPLPTQLKGIPLQLKRIQVLIDRPNFQFNPTSCAPMAITGQISGDGGALVPVSSHFQVSECQRLPFSPVLSASTAGQASKEDGASFLVKITSPGFGQADIAKVFLTLPEALPSRLSTIQKACPSSIFAANPAACNTESVIGHATIHTPVLRTPLVGPAYLVSHGSASFPDVEFVLQGEGITLLLDGKTQIKNGITYSRFESAPDAPFTSFETELPAGPHSALTAYLPKTPYDLCGSKLQMPTEITAQNGAVIDQSTPIAVTGCGAVKGYKLTSAQLLAKALAACRSRYRHSHSRRAACERQARIRYAKKAGHRASRTARPKTRR